MAWASPVPLADRRRSGACPCTSRTGKLLLAHATRLLLDRLPPAVVGRPGNKETGLFGPIRRSSSGWHGQAQCLLRTGGDPGLARARLARASCCLPMPPAFSWIGSHRQLWADPRTRKRGSLDQAGGARLGGMGKPSASCGPEEIRGLPVHVSHGQAAACPCHPPSLGSAHRQLWADPGTRKRGSLDQSGGARLGGMDKPSASCGPEEIRGLPVHVSHGQAAACPCHPPSLGSAPTGSCGPTREQGNGALWTKPEELVWVAWASPAPLADRGRSGACPCTSRTGKLLLAHATRLLLDRLPPAVVGRPGNKETGLFGPSRRSSSGWHGQAQCLFRTGEDPGLARARLARASCCLPMPPAFSWIGSHQQSLTSPRRSPGYAGAPVLSPERRDISPAFGPFRCSCRTPAQGLTTTHAHGNEPVVGAASRTEGSDSSTSMPAVWTPRSGDGNGLAASDSHSPGTTRASTLDLHPAFCASCGRDLSLRAPE